MDMAVLRGNINNACSQHRMTKVEIMGGGGGQGCTGRKLLGNGNKKQRIYGSAHR